MFAAMMFVVSAWADDPPIDINIDLGPDVEMMTYNGGFSQRSSKVNSNATVSVSNPTGSTVVRCTDTEYLEARLNYTVDGTAEGPMKTYGDSIKLAVGGSGTWGNVRSIIGSRPSAVKRVKVDMIVNAPKQSKITISSSDSLQVIGCDGYVNATAAKNGVYVDGNLPGFNVSATQGDVKVVVTNPKPIAIASAAKAPKGNVTVVMPLSQNLKMDARGSTVNVAHTVMGTVNATQATGTIGAGGPLMTVTAAGTVDVKMPDVVTP
jgi:hypothetical protein